MAGVLVGTRVGLVDAETGRTLAWQGREVSALSGGWIVLDEHQIGNRDGGSGAMVDGPPVRCIAGRDGEAWAGTAEAHVFRVGATAELVASFERAEGRDEWYTPWGGPPDVRSLAVGADGTVLVNVHVGGILRSTDGGESWRPTIDLHRDVHQVLAAGAGWALAACADGLAISSDGGATWAVVDDGLPATYCRAVALCGDTVLLSASTGPGGRHSAVYRRPLRGDRPFARCRAGLPEWLDGNVDTFWLAGAGDGTAAFATAGGDVYISADEGTTWQRLATGLPSVRCVVLE